MRDYEFVDVPAANLERMHFECERMIKVGYDLYHISNVYQKRTGADGSTEPYMILVFMQFVAPAG